jgi:nickel-dependent lactate racemase
LTVPEIVAACARDAKSAVTRIAMSVWPEARIILVQGCRETGGTTLR